MSKNHGSERGYFSYRWAIPGYAFILLVIGINFIPLLESIKTVGVSEVFAVFLAFLSLLSGSALGFLVSQSWWWWFNQKGGMLGLDEFEDIEKVLDDYGYTPPKEDKEKRRVTGAVLDFAIYLLKKKELLEYAWRRWDIYHLLSSTYCSVGIGLVSGVILRVLFLISYSFTTVESVLLAPIITCVFFWLVFTRRSRSDIMFRYRPMFEALLRYSISDSENEKALKKVFSDRFNKETP